GVDLLALHGLAGHPATVFKQLEGGIDGTRAWSIEAARALLQLLDHLIAVLGTLLQEVKQRVFKVAMAKHAREAWPHARTHPRTKRKSPRHAPEHAAQHLRTRPCPRATRPGLPACMCVTAPGKCWMRSLPFVITKHSDTLLSSGTPCRPRISCARKRITIYLSYIAVPLPCQDIS